MNSPVIRPASLVLIGEISKTLRAQGRLCATGLLPDDSDASPVVSGKAVTIPQAQIGLMDYNSFSESVSNFMDTGDDNHPWNLVGATSLDAVFCPYNNLTDSDRAGPYMPSWTKPSSVFGVEKVGHSHTLNPYDPFNQLHSLKQTGNSIADDVWFSGGHNLSYALSYNPLDSGNDGGGGYVGSASGAYPSGIGSPVDNYFEKDHWARHTVERSGIRSVGFKGPMVLTGWGYDINNLPVPSQSGNPQRFHPHASWDMHLWKSGPVDLRWDEQRGVWAPFRNRLFLVKMTNLYTPPSFSFEVDRSNSRDQYTRNAPTVASGYLPNEGIADPEYIAYQKNSDNSNYYEQLDYNNVGYPYYEAFIIREADDSPVCSNNYYSIWSHDCQDCGHIVNSCGGGQGSNSTLRKVLIENPLRQSFDVGDLAFTLYTGRQQRVNTGSFTGGTGENATSRITTDANGSGTFSVLNAGSGYSKGGFGIVADGCKPCTNITLVFENGVLIGGVLDPVTNLYPNYFCDILVYPNDATHETELLPIHWVVQSEFKSQQVVTHVETDKGILQTCSMKIQTQGYKTCEWCGEDTAFINN